MANLVDYKKLYEGANRKNKILEASREQQQGTIAQLQEQVADLQRRDNYHDGPNTPSSRNTMTR